MAVISRRRVPTSECSVTPAAIALEQFEKRRAWHARQVAGGHESEAEAEARLLPWLHLACLAGLGSSSEAIADKHLEELCFERGTAIFPWAEAGREVRIPLALSLSNEEREAALRTLAIARNAAIDILDKRSATSTATPPNARSLKGRTAAAAPVAKPSGADAPRPASEGATNGTRALIKLADHLGCPPYPLIDPVTPDLIRGPASLENAR